jgi:hypothetical protein
MRCCPQDPVAVLTNATAKEEFSTTLQNQLAGFFGVTPTQVSEAPGHGLHVHTRGTPGALACSLPECMHACKLHTL